MRESEERRVFSRVFSPVYDATKEVRHDDYLEIYPHKLSGKQVSTKYRTNSTVDSHRKYSLVRNYGVGSQRCIVASIFNKTQRRPDLFAYGPLGSVSRM